MYVVCTYLVGVGVVVAGVVFTNYVSHFTKLAIFSIILTKKIGSHFSEEKNFGSDLNIPYIPTRCCRNCKNKSRKNNR